MTENTIPWLQKVSIFRALSEESLNDVAKITDKVVFNHEEEIFKIDEIADALYIIISGQVRIEQHYRDGRRKTLAYLSEGHFFGEMAIITHEKRCATAMSMQDSQLLKIEKNAFLETLKNNAELCFGILQIICERLQSADAEISNLTFRNLPGRIVYKLFELAEQFGIQTQNGTLINLSLTHYDLADMVGTNRESVSKYISRFKKEGSIEVSKKQITIVDRHKLLSWT